MVCCCAANAGDGNSYAILSRSGLLPVSSRQIGMYARLAENEVLSYFEMCQSEGTMRPVRIDLSMAKYRLRHGSLGLHEYTTIHILNVGH
jgi:hypothetical protein